MTRPRERPIEVSRELAFRVLVKRADAHISYAVTALLTEHDTLRSVRKDLMAFIRKGQKIQKWTLSGR